VRRYRAEGEAGLLDRSSAARRVHNRTPEDRIEVIAALRRVRFTGAEIAELLGMPETTVSGILTRVGLGRLGRLGLEPARRYERSRAGELIHVDVKKLGRIERGAGHRITGRQHYTPRLIDRAGRRRGTAGWEFVHIAIDDATRLAYAEVLPSERRRDCAAFLRRSVAWYAEQGITIERVLSDNAKAYTRTSGATPASNSSSLPATHGCSPWTNGKAEALIKTLLRECAHRFAYPTSSHRTRALNNYLRWLQPTPTTRLTRSPTTDQPRLKRLWSVRLAKPAGLSGPR
jgi:hypothetical protein